MADVLVPQPISQEHLFTCISCTIAFHTAQDQREHYRSDHHRYNMKRRVAGLPPVSSDLFNEKVLQRRAETAIMTSPKGSSCDVCGKNYTTENAYRSHLNSKRHKENEFRAATQAKAPQPAEEAPASAPEAGPSSQYTAASASEAQSVEQVTSHLQDLGLQVDQDATEEETNQSIDDKIAAARARISPTSCLFCTSPASASTSLEENLTHMSIAHSFFVPDAEYLVDLVGLVTYLGEKIAVGNACVYCNSEFRTLDAVRKHMHDKGHCKLAYDAETDRLEVADFYDFETSYPDADERKARKATRAARKAQKAKEKPDAKAEADSDSEEGEEWEDEDNDGGEVDEIVDVEASDESDDDESDEELEDNQVTYGDSPFELVLPSGSRIGHRSMKRYYAQSFSFSPKNGKPDDPNSGAALVRRLLADKNSALVPMKGGFGAYGGGTDVVKARNRGEAREAGRHVREFRDQRRREEFKTKVGYIANSQKHYRAQIL